MAHYHGPNTWELHLYIYIYIAADISKPSETSERRTSTAASKAVIGEKLLGFE